ncbi:MAG: YggU family protein [Syntrophaceae bacterium]|nr:YggU family protein [Syntrophaceae bacterium]
MKETSHGMTFPIQVIPRSRKSEIVGILNDTLKVRLTAPPVDGKANEECVRFFSDLLNIPRNRISIISGQTSRKKTLLISGIGKEDLASMLSVVTPVNRAPELFDSLDQEDQNP